VGGLGSGRYRFSSGRSTTDDYRSIDIRRWQRDGLITSGGSFGWTWKQRGEVVASIRVKTESYAVTLNYRHRLYSGDWKDESYKVQLDWTDCHYGRRRPWFLCPARGCWRRVAILYCGGIFACRHCIRLAYDSQRESPGDRAARRADRIRERLQWEPGILNGEGIKPKGMHWRTYWKLYAAQDRFASTSLAEAMQRFGMSFDELTS
jgi:hypothetical protein